MRPSSWRTSGSAKMDGDAMDDLLEAKAAHIETEGGGDSTSLSWDSLKADADQVFSLALDLLLHPKFDEQKLRWMNGRYLRELAAGNVTSTEVAFFVGCGAYKHHIPASVDHLIQRSAFLTSYTPYQPEIAQGHVPEVVQAVREALGGGPR